MKALIITLSLMLAYGPAFGQLQADADEAAALGLAPGSAAAAPADSAAASPARVAKHSSLTESWRGERNAIRSGNTFANDSNWHKALQQYDEALLVNDKSIRARYNKGVALMHLTSDDGSSSTQQQAAQLFQSVVPDAMAHDTDIARRALYNLGNIAYNGRQYDQAIQSYEASLRIDPDQPNARYNLRLAQLKKEQQDQNQDQQQQQQQQQEQKQQEQQQQEQQQQQQQPQEQPMTQSAEQLLQAMQNQENKTRQRVNEQPEPSQRRQPDKPW